MVRLTERTRNNRALHNKTNEHRANLVCIRKRCIVVGKVNKFQISEWCVLWYISSYLSKLSSTSTNPQLISIDTLINECPKVSGQSFFFMTHEFVFTVFV